MSLKSISRMSFGSEHIFLSFPKVFVTFMYIFIYLFILVSSVPFPQKIKKT